jgi:hypothetical protein
MSALTIDRKGLITIGDDILLTLDDNEDSILKFGIEIRERGTRNTRRVDVHDPTLDAWDRFHGDCATLFVGLAEHFPHMYIPDDIKELYDKPGYQAWARVTAHSFRVKAFRDFVSDIFYTYLDPMVEGLGTGEESVAWLKRNARMTHAMKYFVAILGIDSYIKKNAQYQLQSMGMALATSPASMPTSPKKQENDSPPSKSGGYLGQKLLFDGTPSTNTHRAVS